FFFQAEDGIRDFHVTGVQTCALPISIRAVLKAELREVTCDITKSYKVIAAIWIKPIQREESPWTPLGIVCRVRSHHVLERVVLKDRKSVVQGKSVELCVRGTSQRMHT